MSRGTARQAAHLVVFLIVLLGPWADADGQVLAGWSVVSTTGDARYREASSTDWRPVLLGMVLAEGSRVATGERGRVVLSRGTSTVTVAAQSETEVGGARSGVLYRFFQYLGTILLRIENGPDRNFQVRTPYLAATVKGTVFSVSVDGQGAVVHVTRGLVEVAALSSGNAALVRPGQTARVSSAPNAAVEFIGGSGSGGGTGSGRPQGGEEPVPDPLKPETPGEAARNAGHGNDPGADTDTGASASASASTSADTGSSASLNTAATAAAIAASADAGRRVQGPGRNRVRGTWRGQAPFAAQARAVKGLDDRSGDRRRGDAATKDREESGSDRARRFRIPVRVGEASVDFVRATGGLVPRSGSGLPGDGRSGKGGNDDGAGDRSGGSGVASAAPDSDSGSRPSAVGGGKDVSSASAVSPENGGTAAGLPGRIENEPSGKSVRFRDRDRGRGKGKH
jgi:hypothetical protein